MKSLNPKIMTLAVILLVTAQLALAQIAPPPPGYTLCSDIDCKSDDECLKYTDPLNPYEKNCIKGICFLTNKVKIKIIFNIISIL